MRSMTSKTIFWVRVLALMPLVSSCYVSKLAWRQGQLLASREPIDEILARPDTRPDTKHKLQWTKDVVAFAVTQGLETGDSYSRFVQLDGPGVSYLVQAAKPNELSLKTWWFPVVGRVPYLGFFDVKDRDDVAKELEQGGFEVHRGIATAFSSLGWFSDPVYSSMLADDDDDLAHVYFHELTHRTAWISDSAEFNENFAEFIAAVCTERFLVSRKADMMLAHYRARKLDLENFKTWLRALRSDLETYLSTHQNVALADLITQKNALIAEHVKNPPNFTTGDFVGARPWNNPRILGASLYSPDTARFEKAWNCSHLSSPGEFARKLKQRASKDNDGFQALESFCRDVVAAPKSGGI